MTDTFIDWSELQPKPKCTWCNGTGNAATRQPGMLNYVLCKACNGTGVKDEVKLNEHLADVYGFPISIVGINT